MPFYLFSHTYVCSSTVLYSSWYSSLVYQGPCVSGPLGAGCRAKKQDYQGEDTGDGTETDSTTDGNAASAATTQESAENYYAEPSDTEATAAEYVGKQTSNTGIFGNTNASFAWWMMATAGSVMAALLAVRMGQRKNSSSAQRHEMSGAVMRRMGAVSAFAGAALPGPSKTVELRGVEGVETAQNHEMA
jgi:hypothetical protein